ncbi:MAG: hypothetical protein ACLPQY_29010 [Streptosporangiaceae bacterium]
MSRPSPPGDLAGLIHHTHALCTSIALTQRLAAAGVSGSVGTVGDSPLTG